MISNAFDFNIFYAEGERKRNNERHVYSYNFV